MGVVCRVRDVNFHRISNIETAELYRSSSVVTPPEETEHGTRPGGRGPGVVPGGVGSKNRGGHVRVYRGGLSL